MLAVGLCLVVVALHGPVVIPALHELLSDQLHLFNVQHLQIQWHDYNYVLALQLSRFVDRSNQYFFNQLNLSTILAEYNCWLTEYLAMLLFQCIQIVLLQLHVQDVVVKVVVVQQQNWNAELAQLFQSILIPLVIARKLEQLIEETQLRAVIHQPISVFNNIFENAKVQWLRFLQIDDFIKKCFHCYFFSLKITFILFCIALLNSHFSEMVAQGTFYFKRTVITCTVHLF